MSTTRRDTILKAEESIHALSVELAGAVASRKESQRTINMLEESLEELILARESLERAEATVQSESKTSRTVLTQTHEDLGTAIDFAHERFKDGAASIIAASNVLGAQAHEQQVLLQRIESEYQTGLASIREHFKDLESNSNVQMLELTALLQAIKSEHQTGLARIQNHVRELETNTNAQMLELRSMSTDSRSALEHQFGIVHQHIAGIEARTIQLYRRSWYVMAAIALLVSALVTVAIVV